MFLKLTVRSDSGVTRLELIKAIRAISGCGLHAARHVQETHFPYLHDGWTVVQGGICVLKVDPAQVARFYLRGLDAPAIALPRYTLPPGITVVESDVPAFADLTGE